MLTSEKKEKIYNIACDYAKPYVKKVFKELPNLEDSVFIEAVADHWWELERQYNRAVSVDSVLKSYEKLYESQRKLVKRMSGEDMPPINTEDWKPKYVINEDLTHAVLENVKSKIDFTKKADEYNGDYMSMLAEDLSNERFYGTVVNQETLKKLDKANSLLDIIKTNSRVTIKKFHEANPRSDCGVVAINIVGGLSCLQGTVYKAFRELVGIADELSVIPASENSARIALSFYNLWAESRELTDEELEEEDMLMDELTDEDLEEIENEIERFNKGEFSHD